MRLQIRREQCFQKSIVHKQQRFYHQQRCTIVSQNKLCPLEPLCKSSESFKAPLDQEGTMFLGNLQFTRIRDFSHKQRCAINELSVIKNCAPKSLNSRAVKASKHLQIRGEQCLEEICTSQILEIFPLIRDVQFMNRQSEEIMPP